METFLGIVVVQEDKFTKIHLDHYVKEVITEYSDNIKQVAATEEGTDISWCIIKAEEVQELPYPLKQKHYHSFVAKLQFAATWIQFDISFAVSNLRWHNFVRLRAWRNG